MTKSIVYTGKTHTTGGRDGAARSSDGELDVKLAPPGSPRSGTNPEQMLGAGWSACFLGAIGKAAIEIDQRLPTDASIDAEIDLISDEADGYSLAARLAVSLPGIDRETGEMLIARAHQLCPYSKLSRGNIAAEIVLA
ncbi:Ohr subfamily peroxiredoxin [Sphingopyxis sp. OAS728]|uniref:organic hydroperoxide resistance protein n=1 Tax=Sphingopyxis sp. OAS728 TaxID=2663823 RepID=UPI00178A1482|nr:organic hydroperoxide resistance protein [Sphingopyxis sp. OAS728]MBE1527189.1 Ohr subfamily peroxiredoxin [Sphingopyxis sp. OAS728]